MPDPLDLSRAPRIADMINAWFCSQCGLRDETMRGIDQDGTCSSCGSDCCTWDSVRGHLAHYGWEVVSADDARELYRIRAEATAALCYEGDCAKMTGRARPCPVHDAQPPLPTRDAQYPGEWLDADCNDLSKPIPRAEPSRDFAQIDRENEWDQTPLRKRTDDVQLTEDEQDWFLCNGYGSNAGPKQLQHLIGELQKIAPLLARAGLYVSAAPRAETDDFRTMLREMAQSWRDEAFGGQHCSELRSNILEECADELNAALDEPTPRAELTGEERAVLEAMAVVPEAALLQRAEQGNAASLESRIAALSVALTEADDIRARLEAELVEAYRLLELEKAKDGDTWKERAVTERAAREKAEKESAQYKLWFTETAKSHEATNAHLERAEHERNEHAKHRANLDRKNQELSRENKRLVDYASGCQRERAAAETALASARELLERCSDEMNYDEFDDPAQRALQYDVATWLTSHPSPAPERSDKRSRWNELGELPVTVMATSEYPSPAPCAGCAAARELLVLWYHNRAETESGELIEVATENWLKEHGNG